MPMTRCICDSCDFIFLNGRLRAGGSSIVFVWIICTGFSEFSLELQTICVQAYLDGIYNFIYPLNTTSENDWGAMPIQNMATKVWFNSFFLIRVLTKHSWIICETARKSQFPCGKHSTCFLCHCFTCIRIKMYNILVSYCRIGWNMMPYCIIIWSVQIT